MTWKTGSLNTALPPFFLVPAASLAVKELLQEIPAQTF
jgi:hypothetical protein